MIGFYWHIFIREIEVLIDDVDVAPKSKHLFANLILKTAHQCSGNDHDNKAEGNGCGSYSNDNPGKGFLFGKSDSFRNKKTNIHFMGLSLL